MKHWLVLPMLLLWAGATLAQDAPDSTRYARQVDRRVQQLTESLSLTPEQQTQVRERLMAQPPERREAAQGRARMQQLNAEIEALLDESQKARFRQMQTDATQRRDGNRRPGGPQRLGLDVEAQTQQLTATLHLDEAQQAQVRQALTDFQQRTTAQQSARREDRQAMRNTMRTEREQLDATIEGLLNEDQKNAYRAWQEQQRARMEQDRQRPQDGQQGRGTRRQQRRH
jgi:hypothetical protein